MKLWRNVQYRDAELARLEPLDDPPPPPPPLGSALGVEDVMVGRDGVGGDVGSESDDMMKRESKDQL